MIATEARQDWIPLDPEDNRLQLEAVSAYDALGKVRRSAATSRPHTLLLFMPEDHVNTPESFREYARLTGADTSGSPRNDEAPPAQDAPVAPLAFWCRPSRPTASG